MEDRPGLAAGCSFVLKPSELTPHTAILMMEVLDELGLPTGVANLVLGAGGVVGPGPVQRTRTWTWCPSPAASKPARSSPPPRPRRSRRWRWSWAARTRTSSSRTPTSTPPLDNALNAAFVHSGQVCSAGARLIVEESIAERFVDELVRRAGQIRLGGPFDPDAETGPLISAAHRDKVTAYVDKGVAEGARLRCGGEWGDGRAGQGLLLPAHRAGQVTSGMSVLRRRGVRSRRDRGDVQHRGRGHPARQRHPLRPGRRGLVPGRRQEPAGGPASCATAPSGSTTSTPTCRRRSGAASASPGSAANWAPPAWPSTRRPSTSTRTSIRRSPGGSLTGTEEN